MDSNKAVIFTVRVTGYALMMVSLYQLGGLYWSLLVSGFIAWMPMKWLR